MKTQKSLEKEIEKRRKELKKLLKEAKKEQNKSGTRIYQDWIEKTEKQLKEI